MSFCCIMVHCIMDSIKFKFNDIITLYTKNDSERRRFDSVDRYSSKFKHKITMKKTEFL